jgi:uncharacterized Zn finger protein
MPDRRPPKRGRPPSGGGWWPTASKPIRVEGGLQARSQRGRIGESWWSQRFIAVLESVGVGGRLQRGKHYARIGQVLEIEIFPGRVTAKVQGSRSKPYDVSIQTSVLTPTEWDSAESVMESSAVFLAKLLAGDMPEEIEEAFVGSSGPLFPTSAQEFDSECSCPDWENPCKHIAAVYFLLGEAFDTDPFLIFAWRGRGKDELLTNLRSRRRPKGTTERQAKSEPESTTVSEVGEFGWPAADPDHRAARLASDPGSIWGRDEDLTAIQIRPRLAVAPDLLLRQLDPAALGKEAVRVNDELRPLYEAITAGAAALALEGPVEMPGT